MHLQAARFVSMVPYLEDTALQKRRVDVWSTSAESVYLAAGDAEEHAHLLCGFFLELGQQAFVVMGTSIYGACSYFVLTTGRAEVGPAHQVGRCCNSSVRQCATMGDGRRRVACASFARVGGNGRRHVACALCLRAFVPMRAALGVRWKSLGVAEGSRMAHVDAL